MWQARRLRRQGSWEASAERQRAALAVIAGVLGEGEVVRCAPVRHATGGFFSAVVETEAGPRFVKGVLTGGREARFWAASERGAIRAEGEHYRLLPPLRTVRGRVATVLAFPFLPGLKTQRADRRRTFREHVLAAVRALAEFNASHPGPAPGLGPAAVGRPPRAPGQRVLRRALKVGPEVAGSLAVAAREVEAGWGPVQNAVEAGPCCLAHMDLGIGNVAFGDALGGGSPILLDFGHAGTGPLGADLHAVLRGLDGNGPTAETLAGAYAETFREKGGTIDTATVLRNLEAYFGARYRNLRYYTARERSNYERALAISRRLIDAMR